MSKPAFDAWDVLCSLVTEDGQTWGDRATPVQLADARAAISGPAPFNYWTRARGFGKTEDLAAINLAEALLAPPGSSLDWLAADIEQGQLALDSIRGFEDRTPLIRGRLDIQNRRVVIPETGTRIDILTSDAPSAWGRRPWRISIDELAQHAETASATRLLEAVTTAATKVDGCRLRVITTAGRPSHPAFKLLEHARKSDLWRVSEVDGPAPWQDPAKLAEQRARLPESIYRNLFENEWLENADLFLDEAALAAAFTLAGPARGPIDGRSYFASLDVGLVKDRTVFMVGHKEGGRMQLDLMRVWQGSRAAPVSLDEVEQTILTAWASGYRFTLHLDPWQAKHMTERLRRSSVRVVEFTFSVASKQRLAQTLLQAINDRAVDLFDDAAGSLQAELAALRVKYTTAGTWTFDHQSGRHDDRAVALSLLLVAGISHTPGTVTRTSYRPVGPGALTFRLGGMEFHGPRYVDTDERRPEVLDQIGARGVHLAQQYREQQETERRRPARRDWRDRPGF